MLHPLLGILSPSFHLTFPPFSSNMKCDVSHTVNHTFTCDLINFVFALIRLLLLAGHHHVSRTLSPYKTRARLVHRKVQPLLTLSSTVAAMGMTSKHSLTASHTCAPMSSPNFSKHSLDGENTHTRTHKRINRKTP